MKRFFFAIHLIWLAITVSAQIHQVIDIPTSDIKMTQLGAYQKIEYGYSSYTDSIGYPHIPIIIKAYAIPLDAENVSLQIQACELDTLCTNIILLPNQPVQKDNISNDEIIDINTTFYSQFEQYPDTIARIVSDELIMGYRVVSVAYYPFVYMPLEKSLYKRYIEVDLNYTSIDCATYSATSNASYRRKNIARQFVASLIENKDVVLNNNQPTSSLMRTSTNLSVLNDVIPDYLIITNEKLKSEYQRLADWKTQKGVPTIIKTTEEIEVEYTGADLIEKIANYITDFGNKWGDIGLYVLLGGDTDIIPTREVKSKSNVEIGIMATDAVYADKEFKMTDWSTLACNNGSKNRNIFIGRLPFSKLQETNEFITKLLHYEKCDMNIDYSFLNNLLMTSAFMEGQNTDGYMEHFDNYRKKHFPSYGKYWYLFDHFNCTCTEHDTIDYNGTYGAELNRDNFISVLRDGTLHGYPHLICHKDHGYTGSFGTSAKSKGQNVIKANLGEIRDTTHLNIILSGSCHTANFIGDCIGENFLKKNTIAYIGNTDVGWRDEVFLVEKFLSCLYTEKVNCHIGYIHGQLIFETSKEYHSYHRLHLLGDPEMPIWTNIPQDLDVLVWPINQITANSANPTTIYFKVDNLPEGETATVCIMKDTEIYKVMEVTDTLAHQYQCTPLTGGTMHITVTAHNFRPYETTIPVVGAASVLSIENVDFLSGNDGVISPGESAQLHVTLRNSGSTTVSSGYATMVTNSPYITFTQSRLPITNIRGGSKQKLLAPFCFNVSNNAPEISRKDFNGTTFLLMMNKGDLGTDVDTFRVDMIPPKYKLVSHKTTSSSSLIAGNSYSYITEFVDLGKVASTPRLEIIPETAGVDTITYQTDGEWTVKLSDDYQSNTSVKLRVNLYGGIFLCDSQIIEMKDNLKSIYASNIKHRSEENSITLYWSHSATVYGYHVYRSSTPSGTYTRLNKVPLTGDFYIDENLEANTTYYYKISAINNSLVEGTLSNYIQVKTSCRMRDGFPVQTYDNLYMYMQTPTTVDFDYDGKKEIVAMGWDEGSENSKAVIIHSDGTEPYDADGIAETIDGYMNLYHYRSTPAIGDIYGNGEPCVINVPHMPYGYVYCHSSMDKDGDNQPDLLWATVTGAGSWEDAVVTDLDSPNGKGEKEIILLGNPKEKRITVLNCHGQIKYQLETNIKYDVAKPAVADLNNDGYKEIICCNYDKLAIWSHDGTAYNSPILNFTVPDGDSIKSTPIVCDFDSDGEKEIVVASGQTVSSHIFVIKQDGSCLSGFDGSSSSASIPYSTIGLRGLNHAISVGDIDADGMLEVVALGCNYVKAWNHDGTLCFSKYINGIMSSSVRFLVNSCPILADIDGDESIDILFCIENKIHAIDNTGTNIAGFPLTTSVQVQKGVTVSDIDNDGLNEIIAGDNVGFMYVWETSGKSSAIEWGRAHFDTENTSEYISGYKDQWVITNNTSWNGGTYPNDIIVRSGTFTIPEGVTLDMRKPYRIYVMDGGTLDIKGGNITNADIVVKSGGTLNASKDATISLRKTGGKLQVEEGGRLNLQITSSIE